MYTCILQIRCAKRKLMELIFCFMCLPFLISKTFSDSYYLNSDVTTSKKSSLEPPLSEIHCYLFVVSVFPWCLNDGILEADAISD